MSAEAGRRSKKAAWSTSYETDTALTEIDDVGDRTGVRMKNERKLNNSIFTNSPSGTDSIGHSGT